MLVYLMYIWNCDWYQQWLILAGPRGNRAWIIFEFNLSESFRKPYAKCQAYSYLTLLLIYQINLHFTFQNISRSSSFSVLILWNIFHLSLLVLWIYLMDLQYSTFGTTTRRLRIWDLCKRSTLLWKIPPCLQSRD